MSIFIHLTNSDFVFFILMRKNFERILECMIIGWLYWLSYVDIVFIYMSTIFRGLVIRRYFCIRWISLDMFLPFIYYKCIFGLVVNGITWNFCWWQLLLFSYFVPLKLSTADTNVYLCFYQNQQVFYCLEFSLVTFPRCWNVKWIFSMSFSFSASFSRHWLSTLHLISKTLWNNECQQ